MAKYAYSSLFPSVKVFGDWDTRIDTEAGAGRVPHAFTSLVQEVYGVHVPVHVNTDKKRGQGFLAFRAQHVAYAAMSEDSRAGLDNPPALWVKGHVKRAALYAALDAIAALITKCDSMTDSADWPTLFAPAPKVTKVKAVTPPASVLTVFPDPTPVADSQPADTVATTAMLATFAAPIANAEAASPVSATIALIESGLISADDMVALRNAIEAHDIRVVMASIEADVTESELIEGHEPALM